MFNKHDISRNECMLVGGQGECGNGQGNVKLYRDGNLLDEIIVKNAGCEYGEEFCDNSGKK